MVQSEKFITISGLTNTGKPKMEEISIENIDLGCVETEKIEQIQNHVPKFQLAIRTGETQILFYYNTVEEVNKVINEINDRRNVKS